MAKKIAKRVSVGDDAESAIRDAYAKLSHALGCGEGWVQDACPKPKRTRIVCSGLVRSGIRRAQLYPMVLDVQHDGAFASATYPSKVPIEKVSEVSVLLGEENYAVRYGKFVMNYETREVKFRIHQSLSDIKLETENAKLLLRHMPVKMLDRISSRLDAMLGIKEVGTKKTKTVTSRSR